MTVDTVLTNDAPMVSVVIATRDRPVLLRRALASVAANTYAGVIETIVVFDQSDIDDSIATNHERRPVRTIANGRTPGLAGARNTGALTAQGSLLAFLDDDDEWMPTKIDRQVHVLHDNAQSHFATCGIAIRYEDRDHVRIPDASRLTFKGFLADRMTEVHPSSFLIDRQWFLQDLGMVDETLPGSYAEDYDLLLRASKIGPIVSVDAPLVTVWWHPSTYFRERWNLIDQALRYLISKYPEFRDVPHGLARIYGQQAFAKAAAGKRRGALNSARFALRHNWREPRAYIAALVAAGVSPTFVLRSLHRFGRGL